jgi:hypothetical protein
MPVAVPNARRRSSRDQRCGTAGRLKIRHGSPRPQRVRHSGATAALECQEHLSQVAWRGGEVGAVPVRADREQLPKQAAASRAPGSVPAGRPSAGARSRPGFGLGEARPARPCRPSRASPVICRLIRQADRCSMPPSFSAVIVPFAADQDHSRAVTGSLLNWPVCFQVSRFSADHCLSGNAVRGWEPLAVILLRPRQ